MSKGTWVPDFMKLIEQWKSRYLNKHNLLGKVNMGARSWALARERIRGGKEKEGAPASVVRDE